MEQLELIAKLNGAADCCMALLIPRRQAFDAMRDHVPGVSKGPGYNRKGDALRPDRDIWVVNLNCDEIKQLKCNRDVVKQLNRENTDATDQDLKEHCQDQMAFAGSAQGWGSKGSIPMNSTRAALRKVDTQGTPPPPSSQIAMAKILHRLTDQDPIVRRNAVQSLGNIVDSQDEFGIQILERLCVDPDCTVRLAALQALHKAAEREVKSPSPQVEVDRSFIASHTEGRRPIPREVVSQQPPTRSPTKPSCAWDFRPVASFLRRMLVPACGPDEGNGLCTTATDEQHELNLVDVQSQVVLTRP